MSNWEMEYLNYYLISPGNIYWIKSSGEILISGKNQLLNHEMINKLYKNNQKIEIRNSLSLSVTKQFFEFFNLFESDCLLKDKLKSRDNILELIKNTFLNEDVFQCDINFLLERILSEITIDRKNYYINLDIDYFVRAQNIASAYSMIAFILGYYDIKFIKKLYNNTINNLMAMADGIFPKNFKENMEHIMASGALNEIQILFLNIIKGNANLSNTLPLERLSGDGVSNLSSFEMTDLENIFCTLCVHYDYKNTKKVNIISQINSNEFLLNKNLLNEIKSNLGI